MTSAALARMTALNDLLKPARPTRILDVGANPVNTPPYAELLGAGFCEVWGFEPQPEAFARLQETKGPHEHYLPDAVGDGGRHTLHICSGEGFTSLLPPKRQTIDYLGRWSRHMRVVETHDLTTVRLDDLAALPKPDLLKIDVQGSELMVFQHGRAKLTEAVAVITEVACVPLYEGQPLLHDQMAELAAQGFLLSHFQFLKRKPLVSKLLDGLDTRRMHGQSIDGDALFIRSLLEPDAVSDEQLTHLAIIAEGVCGAFDLTLKCLALLIARGRLTEPDTRDYRSHLPQKG